jgi:hypothetical protein
MNTYLFTCKVLLYARMHLAAGLVVPSSRPVPTTVIMFSENDILVVYLYFGYHYVSRPLVSR